MFYRYAPHADMRAVELGEIIARIGTYALDPEGQVLTEGEIASLTENAQRHFEVREDLESGVA